MCFSLLQIGCFFSYFLIQCCIFSHLSVVMGKQRKPKQKLEQHGHVYPQGSFSPLVCEQSIIIYLTPTRHAACANYSAYIFKTTSSVARKQSSPHLGRHHRGVSSLKAPSAIFLQSFPLPTSLTHPALSPPMLPPTGSCCSGRQTLTCSSSNRSTCQEEEA